MNSRQLIATAVLAISATAPALALANNPTSHGDGTDHVVQQQTQRDQITRQEVLGEYETALQNGTLNLAASDASKIAYTTKSTASRAEVLGMINRVTLTQGDAS